METQWKIYTWSVFHDFPCGYDKSQRLLTRNSEKKKGPGEFTENVVWDNWKRSFHSCIPLIFVACVQKIKWTWCMHTKNYLERVPKRPCKGVRKIPDRISSHRMAKRRPLCWTANPIELKRTSIFPGPGNPSPLTNPIESLRKSPICLGITLDWVPKRQ